MTTRVDLLSPDGHSFLVWVRFSDEDDDDLRLERCGTSEISPDFGDSRIHALDCELDAVGVHDALLEYPARWTGRWRGVSAALEWGVAPKQPFLLSGRIDYEASPDYWSGVVDYEARLEVAVISRDAWTPEQVRDEWDAFLGDRCIDVLLAPTFRRAVIPASAQSRPGRRSRRNE